jgi:hypothetical protein
MPTGNSSNAIMKSYSSSLQHAPLRGKERDGRGEERNGNRERWDEREEAEKEVVESKSMVG